MRSRTTSIVLALFIGIFSSYGASTEYKFKYLSIENGLSKNTVHDIVQDSNGYIWIATFNGLNRFDGYSIKVFRTDSDTHSSIIDNLVTSIDYDGVRNLWAGTSDGLSIFDTKNESFDNRLDGTHIESLEILDEDNAIIATVDSLIIYNKADDSRRLLKYDSKNIKAYTLAKGQRGIYIGTWDKGLFVYSTEEKAIAQITSFTPGTKINSIHCTQNDIWVGTEGNGLFCINEATEKITHYTKETGVIIDNTVRSLKADNSGNIWIGTINGLTIFNEKDQTTTNMKHDSFVLGSISHDSIRTIFIDDQEGAWIGTYFGGVNYWHPLFARFGHIRRLPGNSSINDNVTSCIHEDHNGNIWIGTNKGGLNRVTPERDFKYYKLPLANDIKAVYTNNSSNIYVGAHGGGVNILNSETGLVRHVKGSPADVYSLLKRDQHSFWIGSFNGLHIFDTDTEQLTKVKNNELSSLRILSMYYENGLLWIGAEEGLYIYDASADKISKNLQEKLHSISYVHSFLKSSDNMLWIASINGLYKWDGKELHRFSEKDGLSSDAIHGIEEDSFGRIWLSTDNGLNCFNQSTGSIRSYFVSDGLQSNEFNAYSHCLLSSGQMMFGGIGGITVFKPENLLKNTWTKKPVITKMESGGKEIKIEKDITLNHRSNSLTLTFSAPNYPSWGKNSFAYKLENFDKEWIYTSTYRIASYSNIPKGKYQFLLRAANGDGIWNEEVEIINITILPAWYNTLAAKIGFILIFLIVVWILLKSYLDRKNMKNSLELDKQEKEHREEMNMMKTSFIMNTSHEIRTPLTLILAPLAEMLTRSTDLWMNKQIKGIERNAKRILRLTNQLIDFKHAESGLMKPSVRKENVYKIVNDSFSFYKNLAKMKHIRYTMFSDVENQLHYIDTEYLELILNSLLSNAFKSTDKGAISVSLTMVDENLRLEVTDTGLGMTEDNENSIPLIKKLMELHHGRLDFSSIPGGGSCFTVDFPQSVDAYSEEELKDNISPLVNNPEDSIQENFESDINSENATMYGRILLVENDLELTRILKGRLSKVFEVITAINGEEAQMVIDNQDIDLVIAEEVMPIMGGAKLCQNIKQNFRTSQIPVFIITAKTETVDHMDMLLAGADDYIIKPFSLRILLAKAKNIIRLRRRTLENYTKTTAIVPEKIALTPNDEDFMNRIKTIVENHISDPNLSTEECAKLMNMSRANLHIKISAITGESTLDYINKVRFSEACRLLKEGRYSIAEISDKVGFTSPSYFAARFKKFMGYTPTEYIKNRS